MYVMTIENGGEEMIYNDLQLDTINLDAKKIIAKLKNRELDITNIPEEFALDMKIVRAERQLGLRKSKRRGFDVIRQKFFVEEEWLCRDWINNWGYEENKITFDTFEEYYNFLDGDIYENACYYQYSFKDVFSKTLKLNIKKLKRKKCFISENIDDYKNPLLKEEMDFYIESEYRKKDFKQWIRKFNNCDTYEEFKNVCDEYENSEMKSYAEIMLFQYARSNKPDNKHLNILMEYLSKDYYGDNIVQGLCLIYNPKEVAEKYNYSQATKIVNKRHINLIKKFIDDFENNNNIEKTVVAYFDKKIHYFFEETTIDWYVINRGRKQRRISRVYQAFENFNDFIKHRNGDLRECDLSGAFDLNVDLSKYVIDATTKLPIERNQKLKYEVEKTYENEKFLVKKTWYNKYGYEVKEKTFDFTYFFDFVAFLKGDLSDANLIFCTRMKNLLDIKDINLKNAKLTSKVCKSLNIMYDKYIYDKKLVQEFTCVEDNEKQTQLEKIESKKYGISVDNMDVEGDYRISYISDLHLLHRIKHAECESKEDIYYLIYKIADNIVKESDEIILIGGDVSSTFSIFRLFVKILRKIADQSYVKKEFVFVLGNHELWNFPELSLNQIVEKYRNFLEEYDMYLLHNDLMYKDNKNETNIISYNKLMHFKDSNIIEKLKSSRMVILGGLAFSGYNKKFNANQGIYRETIDRDVEIVESKKFEKLYYKLEKLLDKKNTIIFTHTPKKDWCANESCHKKFVYVSGHTHKSMFHDDGVERIYANNQIGYRNENPHLKNFLLSGEYDCFDYYKDGIYEITSEQYRDFAKGKNINMTFNRKVSILYMLKKKGYYCFIYKTKTGSLCILNGGASKKLDKKDIQFYFDNMELMISTVKNPLDKYTKYQQRISDEIKKIGGSGRIHGCIIDIDYYNHVYVNPIGLEIVSYWASDIINKIVYPNIISLLKEKCPTLYFDYLKAIEMQDDNSVLLKGHRDEKVALEPQKYLETDIYRISVEIKKMQKLYSNILTSWYDTEQLKINSNNQEIDICQNNNLLKDK